ncbi:DDHD domain-containing protein [Mucor mucedo]|uniref:DDHD domain-containing protein n=1 Tax=Mucor mucedo TaxID=29922 RepID=UPI00221E66A5|nr:DDHD domain-containing protein [Mucor mucedo]KAI7892956.1 DDHD domain-containing protein [Mucor mucedo]
MLEPESLSRGHVGRRNPRPLGAMPDLDVPPLIPRWFHAIDNPVMDPISLRRAKSSSTLNKPPKSPSTPKPKLSSKWVPFSQRDSSALEKAYQNHDVRAKVPVNEDHLFQVDVTQRTISPVYWEGPSYEVRRATWFMQTDGWVPCEENIAEQIELGYYKHKPYVTTTPEEDPLKAAAAAAAATEETTEEKKLELTLSGDKQWNLLGPYLGQYIVYTGPNHAWLLSNSTSSKFAKSIITRLTNKQNLGGTRLIRGYPQVEELTLKQKSVPIKKPAVEEVELDSGTCSSDEEVKEELENIQIDDYENEDSEEEVRKIDHLMFVIHGVGQKMSERTGQTFVHDVNVMRKTLKLTFPAAIAPHTRHNGIQVLPIMWRQDVKFGMAADGEEGIEADLGTVGVEDGCPTLDELTLDGVPNIRTVVSDVLMDIPLYMTPRYRELMTQIIAKEINRVYRLFGSKNPEFLEKGKVSIFGHSLGSLLAFDMLTLQPTTPPPPPPSPSATEEHPIPDTNSRKLPPLLFPVQNFFAAGSPLGVILLLRGFKIASRKSLGQSAHTALSDVKSPSPTSINFCYPAVENLYNIFHKSDPVAYRLEPLIARHYTSKLKPEPIPYMKGGLKGVIDASFNVGSGIANRAGAMYESFKMGLTTTLFMRGLGLSRQQIYQDSHPDEEAEEEVDIDSSLAAMDDHNRLTRMRSNSDPARAFSSDFRYKNNNQQSSIKGKSSVRKSPPIPLPTANGTPYSQGAQKLKMLNVTGRVDYSIQEGLLENPYLSAFSAHMQYWQDLDVAAFLIKQIYRETTA